jgi:hypothetical protein
VALLLIGLLLLLAVTTTLTAQVAKGVVQDSVSGAPASGVLVALVDAVTAERRTVLTDPTGQFSVAAAGAGRFTLEIKRIGVRPVVTPPFALAAGETREFTVRVAAVVPRLAAVRVTGRSYCANQLREGGETATLWEEARAALTAALITREQQLFPVTITRFRRTYDPKRLEIQSEDRAEQSGLSSNPFTSVPASVLETKGYIVSDETTGAVSYHGPDLDVLLSAMFVRDHCFSLVVGTGTKEGMVGIAFRPTSARRVPDIAGVLWLDGPTRELRRLEFNYTNDPYEGLWHRFPSYMEYMRVPSGAWISRRWAIRLPLVQVTRPDVTIPGSGGASPTRRLVGILEQGAEASLDDGRASRVPRSLVGVVFDSTAGVGLRGARVSLRGTAYAAFADDAGRFRIDVPDSGTYLLAFEHPRLDSIGYDVRARAVRVADTLTVVDLAVPPITTVRAELCPAARGGASTGIVVGTVRAVSGGAASWTSLRYRWLRLETVRSTEGSPLPSGSAAPVLQSAPGAALVTDSRGRFLICDVPPGLYRLVLESEAGHSAEGELAVSAGAIVARNLSLRRRP